MKKYILIFLFFIFPVVVYASDKEEVKLYKCIDGDTIKVIYNNKKIKVRLLAIDTPEINENYSSEATNFTCDKLKKASKIELEFDKKSKKKDKYNRYLAWVFYDDILLQNELVKKGYAKVAYLYDDYKYANKLIKSNETAIKNKKGIYSLENNDKKDIITKLKNIIKNIVEKINKFLEENI